MSKLDPMDIAPGHNMHRLTNAEVGAEWRLLDEDEVSNAFGRIEHDVIEAFTDGKWSSNRGWSGNASNWTYRTKLSRAELRSARGLPPESDELGEARQRIGELEKERETNIANRPGLQSDICEIRKERDALKSRVGGLDKANEDIADSVIEFLNVSTYNAAGNVVPLEPSLSEAVKNAMSELFRMRSERDALKAELESLTNRLAAERREFTAWQDGPLANMESELDACKVELAILRNGPLNGPLASSEQAVKQLQKRRAEMADELTTCMRERDEARKLLGTRTAEKIRSVHEHSITAEELQIVHQKLIDITRERDAAKASTDWECLRRIRDERDKLMDDLESSNKERRELQQQLAEITNERDDLLKIRNDYRGTLNEISAAAEVGEGLSARQAVLRLKEQLTEKSALCQWMLQSMRELLQRAEGRS